MTKSTELSCSCGQVAMRVLGKPIVSAECLCSDCQQAGEFLQTLPNAPAVLDEKSATRFVLYRKDRVLCATGRKFLREHSLANDSKTRRVVAVCCNTPIFLEFAAGHWLSMYGGLWPTKDLPRLELRTMTRDRPQGVQLPKDVPNPDTHTIAFYAKLVGAWAAMGFKTPNIDFINGRLDAR